MTIILNLSALVPHFVAGAEKKVIQRTAATTTKNLNSPFVVGAEAMTNTISTLAQISHAEFVWSEVTLLQSVPNNNGVTDAVVADILILHAQNQRSEKT